MKRIVLVNASTRSDAPLDMYARALSSAILFQVAPAWDRLPVEVTTAPNPDSLDPDDALITLTDRGDVPNALGWHQVGFGRPVGIVPVLPILEAGGDWLRGAWSVAEVLSHEVFELFCDPWLGDEIRGLDGRAYIREVCDPVEAQPWDVELSDGIVSMSDFVLPSWYREDAAAPYNWNQDAPLLAPRSIAPAGYAQYIDGSEVTRVHGAETPAWRKEMRARPMGRTARHLERASKRAA